MLVLSRRIGEAIVLPGDDVIIRVLSVRGGTIRLGITAPTKTAVHREEVWRRVFQCVPPSPQQLAPQQLAPEPFACGESCDVPNLPR